MEAYLITALVEPDSHNHYYIKAIIALGVAIVALFAWFKASYRRLEVVITKQAKELKDRDDKAAKLTDRLIELERKVGWITSCPARQCPFRQLPRSPND